jgi:hypothetical protein
MYTKKDLLETSDKVCACVIYHSVHMRYTHTHTRTQITKIEGIFSGTLSYLFNTFKPGMKFSDVIADAKEKVRLKKVKKS